MIRRLIFTLVFAFSLTTQARTLSCLTAESQQYPKPEKVTHHEYRFETDAGNEIFELFPSELFPEVYYQIGFSEEMRQLSIAVLVNKGSETRRIGSSADLDQNEMSAKLSFEETLLKGPDDFERMILIDFVCSFNQ